jgi:D-methionine transport system substrate-binding protein
MIKLIFTSIVALFLAGCSSPQTGLKVAATPVPHAQMLEFVKPQLKEKGINLIIITTEDYNMPNRALAQKEVDANFFQHIPFLDEQIKQFHYPIESIAKVELEPMGIYSKKYRFLSEIPMNGTIALPNDPTNEARALRLLEEEGIIALGNPDSLNATVVDIVENPKHLKFLEIDAAMLPRTLDDVDAAGINTNYALQAHLNPLKDALVLEGKDSPYVNVIVVRTGDENRPDIEALKEAMTSEKMREFILKTYKGAIIPAF